jgi:hypothetical protein
MMHVASTTAAATVLVAAAALLPASARASGVVLWACHGPGGGALGDAPFLSGAAGDGLASTYGRGCEGPSGTGGLQATFSQPDPAGGSAASWQLPVPTGVTLQSLRFARATTGFGPTPVSGDPQSYEAGTSTTTIESASLESSDPPLSGEVSVAPIAGEYVNFSVGCALAESESCASPPPPNGTVGVQISSIALGVQDSTPPTGEVAGVQSPVAGGATEQLLLDASDTGLGLATAEATLDGHTVTVVRLGSGACPERPSPSATIDLPYDTGCPQSVSAIPLAVDTGPVGSHELRVSVTDAAGNTTTLLDRTIAVENQPTSPGSDTITLGVGGARPGNGNGNGNGTGKGKGKGKGGVRGSSSSASACLSPLLTMKLASKPLRYVKVKKRRIPLLRARHNYTYRGKLTCLLNGHRVSARIGTVLHVFYKIGRHPAKRSGRGTMTVHKATRKGNLRAILGYSYTSSRTIIFRYHPSKSVLVQVKIPIRVAGGHSKRHGHPTRKRGPGL